MHLNKLFESIKLTKLFGKFKNFNTVLSRLVFLKSDSHHPKKMVLFTSMKTL